MAYNGFATDLYAAKDIVAFDYYGHDDDPPAISSEAKVEILPPVHDQGLTPVDPMGFSRALRLHAIRCRCGTPDRSRASVTAAEETTGGFNRTEVFDLLQKMLVRRGPFNHSSVARIFLQQTADCAYIQFKASVLRYIFADLPPTPTLKAIHRDLQQYLAITYGDHDEQPVSAALILRTGNRLINYFTTVDGQQPSPTCALLVVHNQYHLWGLLLLRILLISRASRAHLQQRFQGLRSYYYQCSAPTSRWLCRFLASLAWALDSYHDNSEFLSADRPAQVLTTPAIPKAVG